MTLLPISTKSGFRSLFLTINAIDTPLDVVFKLQKMGKRWAKDGPRNHSGAYRQLRLPPLNEGQYAITRSHSHFVVGGEGRTLTYEMCEVAHRCIAKGAGLISTNADTGCPTDEGPQPGCGAIVALLEAASGRKAYHVGKPNPFMMRAARKRMGLSTDEITMIGDTMETDLPGATDPGSQFVPVRIVSTKRTQRAHSPCEPTRIVESIAELLPAPAGTY
jgi:NagD protein